MSDDPDAVAVRPPLRTAPRIACFINPEDQAQYFLFVEDKTILSVSSMTKALVLWFALHYIFNLEYSSHVKQVALFFQEFVFGLPATSYVKHHKTATYLTVSTDIQKFVV